MFVNALLFPNMVNPEGIWTKNRQNTAKWKMGAYFVTDFFAKERRKNNPMIHKMVTSEGSKA